MEALDELNKENYLIWERRTVNIGILLSPIQLLDILNM